MNDEYVDCDKSKICKADKICPIPKHIKKTIVMRYGDRYVCPKGIFYKGMKK
jgi:hypothetical protein